MKTILVIEDEPQIRENIQEILLLSNFDAIVAPDGAAGLELAQRHAPDLIICDIMMPELDGYTVLQKLRHTQSTATIPLIFLTAKSERASLRQGMEFGASDYLTKPFEPDELLRAIQVQLEKQDITHQSTQTKLNELRSSITLSLPHELHTPLNGILGMSELLIHDPEMPTEERLEVSQAIRDSALRLHRLTQNFLLYAELEILARDAAQVQRWRLSAVSKEPKLLITHVAQLKAAQANRLHNLNVELQNTELAIAEPHLSKIIEELLDNALKFSKMGSPIWVLGSSDLRAFHLQIIDTGRGMTSEQIANAGAYMQFERKFYEQQGSGLGLTIVKRLVELYGGTFTIESTYSRRTCIHLILPKTQMA